MSTESVPLSFLAHSPVFPSRILYSIEVQGISPMTQTETEKFIKEFRKIGMTPEQRAAEELGEAIGKVIAGTILLFLIPTIIWAVLTFIFALNIAWVKVFGGYFLFNLLKNIIVNSLKK